MKKGCFIRSIVALTIITAAVIYLVQKNWDDWIIKPGKNFAVSIAMDRIHDELKEVNPSAEKDSLVAQLENYLKKKLEATKKIESSDLEFLAVSIRAASSDKKITDEELKNIIVIIQNRSF